MAYYLYLLRAKDMQGLIYKIGISGQPESRFKSVDKSLGGEIELLFTWNLHTQKWAKHYEDLLHDLYRQFSTPATVGLGNGHTEWFAIPDEDLKLVITMCSFWEMAFMCAHGEDWQPCERWAMQDMLTWLDAMRQGGKLSQS